MGLGQKLYEIWQRSCTSLWDDWDQMTQGDREDWETFAENLSIDHGLQLNSN